MGKEQKKIRKKKKKRTKENMAQRRKKNTGRERKWSNMKRDIDRYYGMREGGFPHMKKMLCKCFELMRYIKHSRIYRSS